ncbi:uncharacterized protein LOC103375370 [Stegastes partitus]|uniref:Uncharacterized protein LOC103375370 n=1 Tax=Stegastes partitus TaxID=144197 RepID=A0A9Y4NUL2_9TELE|nr:PREDICTED: uncharacterized protein LOC103375370 [Stegastes partitus]
MSVPPQILPSSDCTKTAGRINCSCEAVGNPFPAFHWYLNGLPVNQSEFVIISERLKNDKGLRSIITGNQPQEMYHSTLTCLSFNSLGSASQHFSLEHQACAESHDQALLLMCSTVIAILIILVCALLCVIRALKNRHNPNSHLTCEMSRVASSQILFKEADELPNTTGEDMYVNTKGLRPPDAADPPTMSKLTGTAVPSSGPNNAKESDGIYSSVS